MKAWDNFYVLFCKYTTIYSESKRWLCINCYILMFSAVVDHNSQSWICWTQLLNTQLAWDTLPLSGNQSKTRCNDYNKWWKQFLADSAKWLVSGVIFVVFNFIWDPLQRRQILMHARDYTISYLLQIHVK